MRAVNAFWVTSGVKYGHRPGSVTGIEKRRLRQASKAEPSVH